jgi:hypothetical protein
MKFPIFSGSPYDDFGIEIDGMNYEMRIMETLESLNKTIRAQDFQSVIVEAEGKCIRPR